MRAYTKGRIGKYPVNLSAHLSIYLSIYACVKMRGAYGQAGEGSADTVQHGLEDGEKERARCCVAQPRMHTNHFGQHPKSNMTATHP
jgi:hypothetical protein